MEEQQGRFDAAGSGPDYVIDSQPWDAFKAKMDNDTDGGSSNPRSVSSKHHRSGSSQRSSSSRSRQLPPKSPSSRSFQQRSTSGSSWGNDGSKEGSLRSEGHVNERSRGGLSAERDASMEDIKVMANEVTDDGEESNGSFESEDEGTYDDSDDETDESNQTEEVEGSLSTSGGRGMSQAYDSVHENSLVSSDPNFASRSGTLPQGSTHADEAEEQSPHRQEEAEESSGSEESESEYGETGSEDDDETMEEVEHSVDADQTEDGSYEEGTTEYESSEEETHDSEMEESYVDGSVDINSRLPDEVDDDDDDRGRKGDFANEHFTTDRGDSRAMDNATTLEAEWPAFGSQNLGSATDLNWQGETEGSPKQKLTPRSEARKFLAEFEGEIAGSKPQQEETLEEQSEDEESSEEEESDESYEDDEESEESYETESGSESGESDEESEERDGPEVDGEMGNQTNFASQGLADFRSGNGATEAIEAHFPSQFESTMGADHEGDDGEDVQASNDEDVSSVEGETDDDDNNNDNDAGNFTTYGAKASLLEDDEMGWAGFADFGGNNASAQQAGPAVDFPAFATESSEAKTLENVGLSNFQPFATEMPTASKATNDWNADQAGSPRTSEKQSPREDVVPNELQQAVATFATARVLEPADMSQAWDPFGGSSGQTTQNNASTPSQSFDASTFSKGTDERKPAPKNVDSSESTSQYTSDMQSSATGAFDLKSIQSSATEQWRNSDSRSTFKRYSGSAASGKLRGSQVGDSEESTFGTNDNSVSRKWQPKGETTAGGLFPTENMGWQFAQDAEATFANEGGGLESNNKNPEQPGTSQQHQTSANGSDGSGRGSRPKVSLEDLGDGINIAEDPRAQELLVMYLKSMGTSTKTAKGIASTFVRQQKVSGETLGSNDSSTSRSNKDKDSVSRLEPIADTEPQVTRENESKSQSESPPTSSYHSRRSNKLSSLVSGSAGANANTYDAAVTVSLDEPPLGHHQQQPYMAQHVGYDQESMGWMGDAQGSVSIAQGSASMPQGPVGMPPGPVGLAGHSPIPNQYSYGLDQYGQTVGAQEQYPGYPSPGAVAGGALSYYSTYGDYGQYDVEYGASPFGHDDGLVEATAVRGNLPLPVAYADSSPLSLQNLCQAGSVRKVFFFCLAIGLIAAGTAIVIFVKESNEFKRNRVPASAAPSLAPSLQPSFILDDLLELAAEVSGMEAVTTPGTPQRRALGWMSTYDQRSSPGFAPGFIQRYALVVWYYSTNGDDWSERDRWLDPNLHECSWSDSIFCKTDVSLAQAINGLDQTKNNLVGTIPVEIGLLSRLEFLRLSDNQLRGSIPPSLFNSTKVSEVVVSNNELSGSLPDNLGDAVDLVQLHVEQNQMNGTIPDGFYSLSLLRVAEMRGNQFSGTLSSRLGELQVMTDLDFAQNALTGTIPALDTLPRFDFIHLDDNLLTGTLPPWVTGLLSRQEITVSNNMLSGTIGAPNATAAPSAAKLRVLDLSHNDFTGDFPPWITELSMLQSFHISHNSFAGPLPTFWAPGTMTNLETLGLSHNLFSGTIPPNLPDNLLQADLASNVLTGGIPTDFCNYPNLQVLFLDNNTLGGSVAPFLECSSRLKTFSAAHCGLVGTLPGSSLSIGAMEILQLSNNTLEGSIPSQFGLFQSLKNVSLRFNSLTGLIPPELAELENLAVLRLDGNGIFGVIPADLGQFNSVEVFSVAGNALEGSIPSKLCGSVGNLTRDRVGCDLECSCCLDPNGFCSNDNDNNTAVLTESGGGGGLRGRLLQ